MKIATICSLLAAAPLFAQVTPECTYTLLHPPAGSIIVFRNGIALEESDYTRSGSGGLRTIAITHFSDGDRMMFYYSYQASAAKVYQPTKEYHTCTGNQTASIPAWVQQTAPDTILLGGFLRVQAQPAASGTVDLSIQCGTQPCLQLGDLPTATNIFGPELAKNQDAGYYEPATVGLRWNSDRDGAVSGIRFQKRANVDAGPHTVLLYGINGAIIAQAVSVGESADGWQQADFAAPVQISAGETLVAAVQFVGGFVRDLSYFINGPIYRYPLRAIAGVVSPGNTLPAMLYEDSNYWVDVVFAASPKAGPSSTSIPDTGVPTVNVRLDGVSEWPDLSGKIAIALDDCLSGESPNGYSACHGGWGVTIAQSPEVAAYSIPVIDGRFKLQ